MKALATTSLLSLLFLGSVAQPSAPPAPARIEALAPDLIPALSLVAPEAPPPPAETVREIAGKAPADLAVSVVADGDGWSLRVARAGHLVALRRGGARAAGAKQAAIAIPRGGEADPVVWETTRLDTLAI